MTSGSRPEKFGLLRLVGGFHSVRACSGVLQAPSYVPQALHDSGVDGARVGS
jgi:hypothetical protein